MSEEKKIGKLEVFPLTPKRWMDFEKLFGPHGASSGCWCMYWRFPTRGNYSATKGEPHRLAMHAIVDSGKIPGLLAYLIGIPAAWVAVAPRSEYLRLEKSKTLYPVDDQPVWSIPCFFIHRDYRRKHLMERLIEAACQHARQRGARILEAYPKDVNEKTRPSNIYMGVTKVFERAGFEVVARREYRPVMRKILD